MLEVLMILAWVLVFATMICVLTMLSLQHKINIIVKERLSALEKRLDNLPGGGDTVDNKNVDAWGNT